MNSSDPQSEFLERIRAFAFSCCDNADTAHDDLHLRRVVANAQSLIEASVTDGQPVDAFVVEAACWLHDCVQIPKGQGQPGEAARHSAEKAAAFVTDLGVEHVLANAISSAIATHSFSGGLPPASAEAAIVQDADRLDALGAIGIARFWVTMVSMGGRMYDPDDPAAVHRDSDDRNWALDHIERKLLRLVDLMNTPAGRAEAEHRTTFLRIYRREFLREIGTKEKP